MGSPLDGTYTVHPRFMNVKYPRNLNDNDLSLCEDTFTFPLNIPTQMSCFLQRIRLGEIIRSVVDARPPGQPDLDITEYHEVLALDRLFEQAISDFPPFLRVDAPIPAGAHQHLDLQRSIIHLGFYSRRARLHRPFLLQEYQKKQYQQSVSICLSSARTVMSIAARLLQKSLAINASSVSDFNLDDRPTTDSPSYHRLGAVISHMFLACTVLALHAGLQSNTTPGSGAIIPNTDTSSYPELGQACQLLSAAGRESPVAAGLVRGLVDVLRRYHFKGVETVGAEEPRNNMFRREDSAPVADDGSPIPVSNEDQAPPDIPVDIDLGLDEIWSDIMNTMPMTDGWDQVFAQLDTFCAAT